MEKLSGKSTKSSFSSFFVSYSFISSNYFLNIWVILYKWGTYFPSIFVQKCILVHIGRKPYYLWWQCTNDVQEGRSQFHKFTQPSHYFSLTKSLAAKPPSQLTSSPHTGTGIEMATLLSSLLALLGDNAYMMSTIFETWLIPLVCIWYWLYTTDRI